MINHDNSNVTVTLAKLVLFVCIEMRRSRESTVVVLSPQAEPAQCYLLLSFVYNCEFVSVLAETVLFLFALFIKFLLTLVLCSWYF